MNLVMIDNVIRDPDKYVSKILSEGFHDFQDGAKVFRGIQQRGEDEFYDFVTSLFSGYKVNVNFARQSPLGQIEPNYIHRDDMMGHLTAILYLSKNHPPDDGTLIYDDDIDLSCRIYSKYNRMVVFNSDCYHSRAIHQNFGEGDDARLIQVIFLERI